MSAVPGPVRVPVGTRATNTPWYEKAAEILADGEWHDGRAVLAEAIKTIPPGVAHREIENADMLRRDGGQRVRPPMPLDRQIAAGKRRLMNKVVSATVRRGKWETDPEWPFGGVWDNEWRVRSVAAQALTVGEVARLFGVTEGTVRYVMDDHPGLPYTTSEKGPIRVARADLDLWRATVTAWVATKADRRADASRRGMATRKVVHGAEFVVSVLGHDPSGLDAAERLRRLAERAQRADVMEAELASLRQTLSAFRTVLGRISPDTLAAVDRALDHTDIVTDWTSHRV